MIDPFTEQNFELGLWELQVHPEQFYRELLAMPDYERSPGKVDGDCELVTTRWVHQGNAVCACIDHRTRRASVILLDAADCEALGARLAALTFSLTDDKDKKGK